MLTRIIDVCLRHRFVVLLVAALSAAWGAVSFHRLPLDAFPDTTPVQVAIDATAPALGPLEVERQITVPIEQAIGGLPGLAEVRSSSRAGASQVVAVFGEGIDVWLARQVTAERVAAVELPDGVRPALGPVATGLGEVLQYLVTSRERNLAALRTLHERVIRPQLLQVPGVAEINTWGGQTPQLHVVVEAEALASLGLTLDDVAGALQRNNRSVGGGTLAIAGEGVAVQGDGLIRSAADAEAIVVAAVDGTPVRLGDVARVEPGHALRRGATTAEGQGEAVLGLGFLLVGENSHAVTDGLIARLDEVRRSLPPDVSVTPVYARTTLVDRVLSTVRTNLLEGALLVVAVLFALLGNFRAGLIVTLAIPLSLLFAFDAMLRFGVAGTLMSLGAIDFGLVVDSSVILVENAERRLAEDRTGRSVREIVRDAAVEVRRPTLFGELIIAVVYLPVLTLEGVEGKMFRPMALTVVFALVGSMLLSLTVMPVLASLVLRRGRPGRRGGTLLSRGLLRLYRPVLGAALRWRPVVLALAVAAVAAAATLAPRLGAEFVPRLREQSIVISMVRGAGVALDESVRVGEGLERLLLDSFPDEIAHIWTRTGTAEVATDPMGPEVSDIFLTLHPREQWTAARTQEGLERRMAEVLEGLPGMRATFTQPVEMRLNEMAAGLRSDVGVKIFGDDLELLRTKAEEVERMISALPGAVDVSVEQLTGAAVLTVEVDREAAGRLGLDVDAILGVVEALGQRVVGQVTDPKQLWRTDIVLRLDGADADPERVEALLVPGPDGQRVRLGDVARVRVVEGPSQVQREWGKRRVVVQANVRGRDVGSFAAELETALGGLDLPDSSWWRIGGQLEHLESARKRLLVVVPLALLLVFALLYLTYGRLRDALRVFTGVPFAAVGGVAALWLRGMPFSVPAAVGFVALFGVSVLGDMVLVSRVRQLVAAGRAQVDAIREAAETRLRPVLMTALVAALGFVPMALSTGLGAEIQRPLATVVIGGIATSTLATLLVLPVLYAALGAKEAAR